MKTIIIIAILVAIFYLIKYLIETRNHLNNMYHDVKQQADSIGIQVAHRGQCLNDALSIAKISYSQEVAGIERLTAKDQLNHLAFLGEKYPQLSAMRDYSNAVNQAFELNMNITAARELMNGNINLYNKAVTEFPACLVAKMFGFKEEKRMDEENYEQNKKVERLAVDFDSFM